MVIRKLAKVDERWNLVYSVPNSSAQSLRSRLHEYRLGLHRGVSDVAVDLPSRDGRYGFLRIEFKSPVGVQSDDQREYQRLVTLYGRGLYLLCRSSDEAFMALSDYLGLDREGFMSKIRKLKPRRRRSSGGVRGDKRGSASQSCIPTPPLLPGPSRRRPMSSDAFFAL